jgi:hypothetical protein
LQKERKANPPRRIETRPLQLQSTGVGVVVGLAVLLMLVVMLWWWRESDPVVSELGLRPQAEQIESVETDLRG